LVFILGLTGRAANTLFGQMTDVVGIDSLKKGEEPKGQNDYQSIYHA
jgi:hypothetical protein